MPKVDQFFRENGEAMTHSTRLPQGLEGAPVGESHTTLGVEVMPVCGTPRGECIRVNFCTNHPGALGHYALACLLGCGVPLVIGPMEFIAVREHCPEPGEIVPAEPGYTDNLNLHCQPPPVKNP